MPLAADRLMSGSLVPDEMRRWSEAESLLTADEEALGRLQADMAAYAAAMETASQAGLAVAKSLVRCMRLTSA